jgi:hypothetical protein
MVAAPTYVAGYERVLDAFGCWPSFHDARVLSFRRSLNVIPIVGIIVHAFEGTAHHRVHFRFTDVTDADLERFWVMGENTLARLAFSAGRHDDGRFSVELDSDIDDDYRGSFRARFGEVLSVTPCDPDGRDPST